MSRLLFWLALAVLVVMAIRSKLRASGIKPPPASRPQPQAPAVESMACCAHCGVYFPASEAVRADGLDYCSPAHVRLPAK
jgi:uncharacterized protein